MADGGKEEKRVKGEREGDMKGPTTCRQHEAGDLQPFLLIFFVWQTASAMGLPLPLPVHLSLLSASLLFISCSRRLMHVLINILRAREDFLRFMVILF